MTIYTNEEGRVNAISHEQGERFQLPDGMTMENFGDYVLKGKKYVYDPLPKDEGEDQGKTVSRLKTQIQAQAETLAMYEEILVEMAEIVYA